MTNAKKTFKFTYEGAMAITFDSLTTDYTMTEYFKFDDEVESESDERPSLKELRQQAARSLREKMRDINCNEYGFDEVDFDFYVDGVEHDYNEENTDEKGYYY